MWSNARFCPVCAAELVTAEVYGRTRRRCSSCTFVLYANPAGAAGAVVVDADRRVLLVRRGIEPFRGQWALPAGYQEADESPVRAAEREVEEETGVRVRTVALLDLVFVPDDPRKPANVALFLAVPRSGLAAEGRDDALAAEWFHIDALPAPLAFESTGAVLDRLKAESDEARVWWNRWRRGLDAANEPPSERPSEPPPGR